MKITFMQAIFIFWICMLIWIMVEYLFYRIQNYNSTKNNLGNDDNKHIIEG